LPSGLIEAVDGDQQLLGVGRERDAVGRFADFERLHDLVGRGIDDAHGRRSVARHIDGAPVRGDRHSVRPLRDRNGGHDLSGTRIEHRYGIVREVAHIGLGGGDGHSGNQDKRRRGQQQAGEPRAVSGSHGNDLLEFARGGAAPPWRCAISLAT
jgi:hypothetical protein